MMTLFSEKVLISRRCKSGLMPNLIKKSWTDSTQDFVVNEEESFDRYEQRKKGAEVMFFVVLLCIYFQSEIRF
jgi:hypothetical protein